MSLKFTEKIETKAEAIYNKKYGKFLYQEEEGVERGDGGFAAAQNSDGLEIPRGMDWYEMPEDHYFKLVNKRGYKFIIDTLVNLRIANIDSFVDASRRALELIVAIQKKFPQKDQKMYERYLNEEAPETHVLDLKGKEWYQMPYSYFKNLAKKKGIRKILNAMAGISGYTMQRRPDESRMAEEIIKRLKKDFKSQLAKEGKKLTEEETLLEFGEFGDISRQVVILGNEALTALFSAFENTMDVLSKKLYHSAQQKGGEELADKAGIFKKGKLTKKAKSKIKKYLKRISKSLSYTIHQTLKTRVMESFGSPSIALDNFQKTGYSKITSKQWSKVGGPFPPIPRGHKAEEVRAFMGIPQKARWFRMNTSHFVNLKEVYPEYVIIAGLAELIKLEEAKSKLLKIPVLWRLVKSPPISRMGKLLTIMKKVDPVEFKLILKILEDQVDGFGLKVKFNLSEKKGFTVRKIDFKKEFLEDLLDDYREAIPQGSKRDLSGNVYFPGETAPDKKTGMKMRYKGKLHKKRMPESKESIFRNKIETSAREELASCNIHLKENPIEYWEEILEDWNNPDAREYALTLIEEYGDPHFRGHDFLVWAKVSGFKKLEVRDEAIESSLPRGNGFLYVTKDISLSPEDVSSLAKISNSFIVDLQKEEVTVRCEKLLDGAISHGFVEEVSSGLQSSYKGEDTSAAKSRYFYLLNKAIFPEWYKNRLGEEPLVEIDEIFEGLPGLPLTIKTVSEETLESPSPLKRSFNSLYFYKKFFLKEKREREAVLYQEVGNWFRETYIPLAEISGFKRFGGRSDEEGFSKAFSEYFQNGDHKKEFKEWMKGKKEKVETWIKEALGVLSNSLLEFQVGSGLEYQKRQKRNRRVKKVTYQRAAKKRWQKDGAKMVKAIQGARDSQKGKMIAKSLSGFLKRKAKTEMVEEIENLFSEINIPEAEILKTYLPELIEEEEFLTDLSLLLVNPSTFTESIYNPYHRFVLHFLKESEIENISSIEEEDFQDLKSEWKIYQETLEEATDDEGVNLIHPFPNLVHGKVAPADLTSMASPPGGSYPPIARYPQVPFPVGSGRDINLKNHLALYGSEWVNSTCKKCSGQYYYPVNCPDPTYCPEHGGKMAVNHPSEVDPTMTFIKAGSASAREK